MDNQSLLIQLEPKSIASCTSLPNELDFMEQALQHQVDVFEQSIDHDLILDLAPTGTGKTKAGLLVLQHNPNKSAIYIAPTNALVTQQAEAAEKFIKDANLPHVVKAASAREVKDWPDDRVGRRSGEKLYNVLRNPATIFPEVGANRPILLVTNPDIFYYATFFAYCQPDKTNIASQFYSKFSTVIFDEFHLYSSKQLVSLLFFIAYSYVLKFFQQGRRVVLLTATPEPACEEALKILAQAGLKIARIDGENSCYHQLPSQTAVNLEIRPKSDRDEWLAEIASQVKQYIHLYPDQNGAVILDSKDHINRLADLLENQGLTGLYGRIHGSTPQRERLLSVQKQIILATSTVDVGFNFEKQPSPTRQNLDWLIFSARDRFSFWQRLGRVGRVLGKLETDIPSQAIAYLPTQAWEQGIFSLDCTGGREALKNKLESLACLNRPFLDIYWRSEASLEIAKPLIELEENLENLPDIKIIEELYQTMQLILGGKRDWNYYRYRIKALRGAEKIAETSIKSLKTKWKFIKGGQAFVKVFLKTYYPEDWENLQACPELIGNYEELFQNDERRAEELQRFAKLWEASYQAVFQFREGLFDNLKIFDPKHLLLDESEETFLDPIHLLRYYEFARKDERIEIIDRAKTTYELTFRLYCHAQNYEDFKNTQLNKLTAFAHCRIERRLGGCLVPTLLIEELKKQLIPGVIIPTQTNQGIIIQLRKQGLVSYPIFVSFYDLPKPKEYTFFPGLSGILAIAASGVRLRLPDDEDFYIV